VRKKDAKQNAAKEAVTWLVDNGYLNIDLSVPKPSAPPTEVSSTAGLEGQSPALPGATAMGETGALSIAAQVPPLCISLGFSPPAYNMTKVEGSTSIYDIYAHFPGDMRITERIGEFKNVYGKKNAKEMCAREVLAYMRNFGRQRAEHVKDDQVKEEQYKQQEQVRQKYFLQEQAKQEQAEKNQAKEEQAKEAPGKRKRELEADQGSGAKIVKAIDNNTER
jgi:hypothetical protein